MQIVVDIPKGHEQRVLDAFCTDRWTEDSGYTQEEFVNKLTGDWVNSLITDYEKTEAVKVAQEQISAPVVVDKIAEAKAASPE